MFAPEAFAPTEAVAGLPMLCVLAITFANGHIVVLPGNGSVTHTLTLHSHALHSLHLHTDSHTLTDSHTHTHTHTHFLHAPHLALARLSPPSAGFVASLFAFSVGAGVGGRCDTFFLVLLLPLSRLLVLSSTVDPSGAASGCASIPLACAWLSPPSVYTLTLLLKESEAAPSCC